MSEKVKEFLLKVADAPASQIDPEICERLRAACDDLSTEKLVAIMSDCVNYSLCSNFAIIAMEAALSELHDPKWI